MNAAVIRRVTSAPAPVHQQTHSGRFAARELAPQPQNSFVLSMKIHPRLTLTCLLAFGGQLGAMAQTAAPAPADQTTTTTTTTTTTPAPLPVNNGPAVAEQTVELSPFEVNSTKDNGYAATETLAGTRIATNLADVAASIS